MKRIVGVSIGSSKRNKRIEKKIGGEKVIIERIGTDGDIERMKEIYKELDGKVDAFGIGGTNFALYVNGITYELPEFKNIKRDIKTKIFDGEGVKEVLEKNIDDFIENNSSIELRGKKGYTPSAVDRYSMTLSLERAGVRMWCADLLSAFDIPLVLPSLKYIDCIAPKIIPPLIIDGFKIFGKKIGPFSLKDLYPTGEEQDELTKKKKGWKWVLNYVSNQFQKNADIIAGDCLFVKKYLPNNLEGKIIITNTTTEQDYNLFKERGASYLITTTPIFDGRSFGTNVIEATLYALDYHDKIKEGIKELGIGPQITKLN